MRIADVLRSKGSEVVTVPPDASVRELLTRLAERRVGALVVSPDGGTVAGIVSERDVVRRLAELGPSMLDSPVASIMTADVLTCTGDSAVEQVMQLMTENRVRHVPVVRDGRLVGIVSIGDVVKQRLGELQTERDHLSSYISS